VTDLKFTSPSGETTIKLEGTGRLGTVAPKTQLHIKMDEPVKYETPMTENEEEIEKVKAQIKVLEKKLSFLEELEKTKSPVEEAYNEWYGEYPTNTWQGDVNRWDAFQAGYNAAYEEKVSEWQPTPQTPEQVADGLKEAFKEAVKQGVVSSTKSKTLTDIIYRWWEDVFTTHSDWDMETSIEDLVDQIQLWLPKEHDTNSYKWNECIRMIKEKLR
jgi:polyhydroxyalkanoate synthesis regulator phasin